MEAQTRRQPLSVTVVILIYAVEIGSLVLNALGYLAAAGITLSDLRASLSAAMASTETAVQVYIAFMSLLIAIVDLVALRGLYHLRPWAWRLAVGLQGARLLLGLYAFFSGHGLSLSLFLPILIVFLLNQREARRVFGQMEGGHATASVIRQE